MASIFECYVRFYVVHQQAERPAAENPARIKMVLLYRLLKERKNLVFLPEKIAVRNKS